MDEVAVSSVDFNEFEAGFEGAASALGESMGDARNAFGCEGFGLNGLRGEALGRGGIDGTPASLGNRDGPPLIVPRNRGEALKPA